MKTFDLKPCPNKPNCVSSLSKDKEHYVQPISFEGDWMLVKQTLIEVLKQIPRTQIVTNEHTYLHVTFKSRILRFVDDVEFLFDDVGHQIQVRSASRVGYSDFGVNRKRIERIRKMLQ